MDVARETGTGLAPHEAPVFTNGASRFAPPPLSISTLHREALLDRLDEGLECRLALVTAPAGYGKTTILTLWGNRLTSKGVRIAWLNTSAADNDPDDFCAGIAAALNFAGIEKTPRVQLDDLLAELGCTEERVALIIDDFHKAGPGPPEGVIRRIIEQAPSNVHLVIASRSRSNVGAPVLRARGQVMDVMVEDLAFNTDEMASLLSDVLPSSIVGVIADQTEGWPIVLGVIKSFACRHDVEQQASTTLHRAAEDIVEFIDADVLGHWPPDQRHMLVEASLFDAFNDDLMAELQELSRLPASLEKSAEAELPTKRCGTDGRWLRLNRILLRHLREQSLLLPEDHSRKLRMRGARYFARIGDVREAIRQARAAEDYDFVAELVEHDGIVALTAKQGMSPLRELLDGMPQDFAQSHPHLRLGRVLLIAKDGRVQEARQLLHNAMAEGATIMDDLALPRDPFEQDCVLLDQLLGYYEDAVISDEQLAQVEARARDFAEDPWLSGWANNVLFMSHFGRGNILAARVAAETAFARYAETGNLYPQIIMRGHLAALDLADSDLVGARAHLQVARAEAEEHFPGDPPLIALLNIPYAELLRESGETQEAAALIEPSLEIIERNEGWVDLFARGYKVGLQLALASGNLEAAGRIVARCERTAHERSLRRLSAYALFYRIELALFSGDMPKAVELAARFDDITPEEQLSTVGWRERQYARLLFARVAAAQGEVERSSRILEILEQEIADRGPRWFELPAQLLRAMLLEKEGRLDDAAAQMRLALNAGARQGRRRTFLDEGPALASCLIRISRHVGLASLTPDAASFLASIVAAQGEELCDKSVQPRIFSARELQVLQELSLGKANKVIARALNLTEATVKFHLAHVYEKLGVNNRVLAAAVARERGLVD